MHLIAEFFPRLFEATTPQVSGKARRKCRLIGKAGLARPGRHLVYCLCAVVVLCPILALCPASTAAQVDQQIPPPLAPRTNNPPGPDTTLRKMTERMAKERNTERQKKIVADTEKLLAMAQKLNDEVSHSTKNELAVDVVQQAAEIEKLAKSIKEKMRNGY